MELTIQIDHEKWLFDALNYYQDDRTGFEVAGDGFEDAYLQQFEGETGESLSECDLSDIADQLINDFFQSILADVKDPLDQLLIVNQVFRNVEDLDTIYVNRLLDKVSELMTNQCMTDESFERQLEQRKKDMLRMAGMGGEEIPPVQHTAMGQ